MDHNVDQYIAEEIALLTLICDVPERPGQNIPSVDIRNNNQGGRVLTFERERDIVDNLAFLAAADEDPDKVIAVCIEELHGNKGLKVILTVNKGGLDIVKDGLESMFLILKDVSSLAGESARKYDEIKEKLLMEIIALNHNRLLCRLRSKHAKSSYLRRQRSPLNIQLAHAARLTRKLGTTIDQPTLETLVECQRFQSLSRQLDAAKATKTHDLLADLVKCAHQLTTRFNLERIIGLLPNSEGFGPNSREALLSRMQKVGRYQSACEFLLSAARKISIFKHVDVEVIKLPDPITLKPQSLASGPRLAAALKRANLSSEVNRQGLYRAIVRKARALKNLTYPLAEVAFEDRRQNIHSSARIHAEIQIIYYYEINPSLIRPRVICSSKSACFLCDLFAKTHGKFHIERTHGRLYGKWRLPTTRALNSPQPSHDALLAVLEKFDNALKNRIKDTVQHRDRSIHVHPNESVFIHPPTWTPSRVSEVTNDETVRKAGSIAGSSTPTLTLRVLGQPDTPHVEKTEPANDQASTIKQNSYSDVSSPRNERLVKGKRIQRDLSRLGQSLYFESPGLHFSIGSPISNKSATETEQSGNDAGISSLEIEWLNDEEVARIRNMQMNLVDVGSMKGGTEVTTTQGSSRTPDGLYMSFSGGIVYFKYNNQKSGEYLSAGKP